MGLAGDEFGGIAGEKLRLSLQIGFGRGAKDQALRLKPGDMMLKG